MLSSECEIKVSRMGRKVARIVASLVCITAPLVRVSSFFGKSLYAVGCDETRMSRGENPTAPRSLTKV